MHTILYLLLSLSLFSNSETAEPIVIPQETMVLTVDLGPDTTLCSGPLMLDAGDFGSGTTWLWSTGETTQTIQADTSGTYYVDVMQGSDSGTDTILVTFTAPVSPITSDSSFCAGTSLQLSATSSGGYLVWYDSLTAPNPFFVGDTLTTILSDTTTYYLAASATESAGNLGLPDNSNGGAYISGLGIGVAFDVMNTLILDSVAVYVDAATTMTVSLENNSGQSLYNETFTVNSPMVKSFLPLDFFIAPGIGYKLILTSITGGGVFRATGQNYSAANFEIPGIIDLTSSSIGNSAYYYFYDLNVSTFSCESNRTPITANIVSAPTIDLGPDTLICGSLLLDAGVPNATYFWSTGETTQSITVSQSDTISLQSYFNANCPSSDTAIISIIPLPTDPLVNDSSYCVGDTVSIPVTSDGFIFWYDSATATLPMFIGDTFTSMLLDTTSFFVEAGTQVYAGSLGIPDNSVGGAYIAGVGLGLRFSVFEPMILDSIAVYVDAPTSLSLEVLDNTGTIIDSKSFTVNAPNVKVFLDLGFLLLPGNDYEMVLTAVSGGGIFRTTGQNYSLPQFEVPGVIDITSANNGGSAYYYFYDWHVSTFLCTSNRVSVTANMVPTPLIDLGNDTLVCGSLTLDAGVSNANYFWSTGETTPTITVNMSDTVTLESYFLSQCRIEDTIIVDVIPILPAPAVADTTICKGDSILVLVPGGDYVLWYDSIQTMLPFFIGDSLVLTPSDTTTYYLGRSQQVPIGNVAKPDNQTNNGGYIKGLGLGIKFDVTTPIFIDSVAVFVDSSLVMRIQLQDDLGTVLDETTVLISQDSVKVNVPVNFSVPPGQGYNLILSDIIGGNIYRETGVTYDPSFDLPGIIDIVSASNGGSAYYYFYDWQISGYGCASNRVPFQVNVIPTPAIDLGNDTLVCGPLILDAGNPGATFNWSSNETSQSITVSASDTLSLIAEFDALCPVFDTISIGIIDIPAPPLVNDSSFCSNEQIVIPASGNGDSFLWYDTLTGGNAFFLGDTLRWQTQDSVTYYLENANSIAAGRLSPLDTLVSGNGSFINGSGVGIEFDAFSSMILDRVTFYFNDTSIFDIELYDHTGVLLSSKSFTVNTDSIIGQTLELGFSLVADTNYQLIVNNVISGGLYRNTGSIPYPFELPGLVSITNANNNANAYYYFYGLEISTFGCASTRTPFQLDIIPTPELNLGEDTLQCGGTITLNAGVANATYIWSTGSTADSITLSASDTVILETFFTPNCRISDTLEALIIPIPTDPVVMGFSICNETDTFAFVQNPNGLYLWYDSPMATDAIGFGDSLFLLVSDTIQLFVENSAVLPTDLTAGPDSNAFGNGGYINGVDIGLSFDIVQDLYIDSVAVYVDDTTYLEVQLLNSDGKILNSRSDTVFNDSIKTYFHLGFGVSVGTGYQLILKDISGGNIYRNNNGSNYPYDLPGWISITSASNGSPAPYYYFYDWKISSFSCRSSRVPFTITVDLPIDLGSEIYTCNETWTLDAGNPGTQYLWNTGATTQQLTVSDSGFYSVQINDGLGCTTTDTVRVDFPFESGIPEDGIFCGNVLSTNYSGDPVALHVWNTGDSTQTLMINSAGTYWVTIYEPLGCVIEDTINITGFDNFPTVNLGQDFATCDSATLDAGNPGLSYLWSTGETTQTITVYAIGAYSVAVSNSNGCTTEDTITVNVFPQPTAAFNFTTNGLEVCLNNGSTFGAYLWNFGDGTSSNAVSPCHTYISPGTYVLQLVVQNSCGADTLSDTVTVFPNAIQENLTFGAKVYPVPTRDFIMLEVETLTPGPMSYEVLDLSGKKILDHKLEIHSKWVQSQINVKALAAGMYYLKIRMNDGILSKKVIIEK